MNDLISRQAAIDRLTEYGNGRAVFISVGEAIIRIEQLPPAQPEQLGTNLAEVGTDCISRQAVKEILDKNQMPYHVYPYVWDAINALPPAQPEIIRCKDCKHWIPYDWMFSEVWQSKNIADYPEDEIGCNYCDMAMKANDFCSRGERREV